MSADFIQVATLAVAVIVPLASAAASWGGLKSTARAVDGSAKELRAEIEKMEGRVTTQISQLITQLRDVDERLRQHAEAIAVLRDRQDRIRDK